MMENLRRLVWKVESLSKTTNLRSRATKEIPLPTIPEENEDASSHHSKESSQAQFDDFGDAVEETLETPQIYNELAIHNVPDTTAAGDLGEVGETIFYIFPVRHDTPLGEWMMGRFECLYCGVLHKLLIVF